MKSIRSTLVIDQAMSASTTVTYDLPVNPLSHVVLTLKALNVTDEATLAEILARLTKINVSSSGGSVFDMSGADLFALNCVLFGDVPLLENRIATDNATRYISLIIPFGRSPFMPTECYPKTMKGEFKLQITFSATETACDGMILQVETVELVGATPTRYLKCSTLSDTPAATGDMDVDLPIGNQIAGVLLYGTTIVATTAWTNTIEAVKVLADNMEFEYALAYWESLHGDLLRRIGYRGTYAAAGGDDLIAHYSFLDFFPDWGDGFLLESKGLSSLKVRITAGDTNALRVCPIELRKV